MWLIDISSMSRCENVLLNRYLHVMLTGSVLMNMRKIKIWGQLLLLINVWK